MSELKKRRISSSSELELESVDEFLNVNYPFLKRSIRASKEIKSNPLIYTNEMAVLILII